MDWAATKTVSALDQVSLANKYDFELKDATRFYPKYSNPVIVVFDNGNMAVGVYREFLGHFVDPHDENCMERDMWKYHKVVYWKAIG